MILADLTAPVLCVDFGTSTTQAALLKGDEVRLLHDPVGGSSNWPSAVYAEGDTLLVGRAAERRKRVHPERYRHEFKRDLGQGAPIRLGGVSRTAEELLTTLLRTLRAEAERLSGWPVTEALLTFPASYGPKDPRRGAMLEAAAHAGLGVAELLPEPVAAALSPPAGKPFAPGDLILVYDFGGGTFDTALVRVGATGHEVLGHGALEDCGGRDLDARVAEELQKKFAGVRPPTTGGTTPEAMLRAQLDLNDLSLELKEQLSSGENAEEFTRTDIQVTLDRKTLTGLATPLLDRTIDRCGNLIRAAKCDVSQITAVLTVGGTCRSPVVTDHLTRHFGAPIRQPENAQHAVVLGAAVWARATPARVIRPARPAPGITPLAWELPSGRAELIRQQTVTGDSFRAGDTLARIRDREGAIHHLIADTSGTVVNWHAQVRHTVHSGDWIVTTAAGASGAGSTASTQLPAEPPLMEWSAHQAPVGAVAFSPDGRFLATADHHGTVTIRNLTTGESAPTVELARPVTALAVDSRRGLVAAGLEGGGIEIFDFAGETRLTSVGTEDEIETMTFGDAGAWLAAADGSGTLGWATDDWTELASEELRGDAGGLATRVGDALLLGDVRAFTLLDTLGDLDDGLLPLALFGGLTADGGGPLVAVTPGGVLSAGHRPGAVLRIDARHLAQAARSASRLLLAGYTGGDIQLWSLAGGELLGDLGVSGEVLSMAFSPDGGRLAVGQDDGAVLIWNLTDDAPPVAPAGATWAPGSGPS